MNSLNGKNILLIAPKYFDYEIAITDELEMKGAKVYFIKENLDYGFSLERMIGDINTTFNNYIAKCIDKYRGVSFDYIFCIRINNFTPEIMENLRTRYPKSIIIIYFWDSVKNMKAPLSLVSFGDKVFSFDPVDCSKYHWNFRPLFYKNMYKDIANDKKQAQSTSVFMIATLTPLRAQITEHLIEIFEQNKIVYDFSLYMNPIIYYKRKLFNREYENIKSQKIIFKRIPENLLALKLMQCDIMLDICHESQTGLTMRAIEAFGAKRRLITNNTDIKNYDFYDKEHIFVYRDNDEALIEFILTGIKNYPEDNKIYKKYSISGWIDEIFGLESDNEH